MKIFIIVIILLLALFLLLFNSLVKSKQKVKQAKSGIDVYLQQRFDLIPNLVETVKAYTNYESDLFENIAQLRTQYNENKDIKLGKELDAKLKSIFAIAENYPDLKASEQFLELQKSLSKMENQLQAARRIYNTDVTDYNTKIKSIPYNIIAALLGFKEEELFQIADEAKQNISINL